MIIIFSKNNQKKSRWISSKIIFSCLHPHSTFHTFCVYVFNQNHAIKSTMLTSSIGMVSRVIECLSLPQLILGLYIWNRSTCFIVFNNSSGSIEGILRGKNILKNSEKNQFLGGKSNARILQVGW